MPIMLWSLRKLNYKIKMHRNLFFQILSKCSNKIYFLILLVAFIMIFLFLIISLETAVKITQWEYAFLKDFWWKNWNHKNICFIGLDGTYKLTNIRYPLIVMINVDLRHRVHPIAFCISNTEDKETYDYFIKASI